MAESYVEVTEGSGKKLHALNRTVASQTVYDEAIAHAIPHYPTYMVRAYGVSLGVAAGSHLVQVMAGSTNNVYITNIRMYQLNMATALTAGQYSVVRLSSAGSGGTALTPNPLDTADPAAGATARQGITTPGTEGTTLLTRPGVIIAALTAAVSRNEPFIFEASGLYKKALKIPAGVTNGICLRNAVDAPGATCVIEIEFFEAPY